MKLKGVDFSVDKNNNFNIEFKNDDSHFTIKGQKLGW